MSASSPFREAFLKYSFLWHGPSFLSFPGIHSTVSVDRFFVLNDFFYPAPGFPFMIQVKAAPFLLFGSLDTQGSYTPGIARSPGRAMLVVVWVWS